MFGNLLKDVGSAIGNVASGVGHFLGVGNKPQAPQQQPQQPVIHTPASAVANPGSLNIGQLADMINQSTGFSPKIQQNPTPIPYQNPVSAAAKGVENYLGNRITQANKPLVAKNPTTGKVGFTPQGVQRLQTIGSSTGDSGLAGDVDNAIKGVGEGALKDVKSGLKDLEAATTKPATHVPINSLTSYEGTDKGAVEAVKAHIKAGNAIEPLKIAPDSLGNIGVVDGKHRLQALKELGYTKAPVETDNIAQGLGLTPQANAKVGTQVAEKEATTRASLANSINRPKEPIESGQLNLTNNPIQPNKAILAAAPKSTILNGMGDGGKNLVGIFNKQFDDEELYKEATKKKFSPFFKLSNNDAEAVRNAVQTGKVSNLSPAAREAVETLRKGLPGVRNDAISSGVSTGNLGETYFPRVTDWDKVKVGSSEYNKALEHLVNSGQATDLAQATQMIEDQRNLTGTFGKYGNLTKSRTLDTPLPQVPAKEALDAYLTHSAETITKASNFGPKGELIRQNLAQMIKDGYDGQTASKTIDRIMNAPKTSQLGKQVRGVFGFARLSKAAISHSTQLINTASQVGFGRTAANIAKIALSPEERAYAESTGVLQGIKGIQRQTGLEGAVGKGTAPLLTPVMKLNRLVTASAGRDAAVAAAKRGDTDFLERTLGLDTSKLAHDPEGKISLTKNDIIQASRNLVKNTMFRDSRLDTPLWAETEGGKFAGQYRMAYSYKQTGMIYNQVLKEAKNGNIAPLLRYVVGGAAAFGAPLAIKAAISGGKAPTPTSIAESGAGLPGEVASSLPFIKSQPGQNIAGLVAPAAGEAVQAGQDASNALQGSPKALERYGIGLLPLAGSRLSKGIVPPASPQALAYYQTLTAATKSLSNKEDVNALNTVEGKMFDPSTGKSIQNGPKDTISINRLLYDHPNVSTALQKQAQNYSKQTAQPLDPKWALTGNGIDANGKQESKLQVYANYESQYTGDPIKTLMVQQNPWITQLTSARTAFYNQNPLPPSKSEANPNTPAYPAFDPQTQSLLNQYDAGNAAQKTALISAYPQLGTAFDQIGTYTNQMRSAEGAPAEQPYPTASPSVQAALNAKNYKAPGVEQYLSSVSLYNVAKGGQVAALQGGQAPANYLKSIYDAGFDISKNADGSYSISAAAGGSGSSSSGVNNEYRIRIPRLKDLGPLRPRGGGVKHVQFKWHAPQGGRAKPVVTGGSTPRLVTANSGSQVQSQSNVVKSGKNK